MPLQLKPASISQKTAPHLFAAKGQEPVKSRSLDQLTTPYSSLFGQDYGDFAMRSSDNMLLTFPKSLLGHASPFFRDMFSIGEHASESTADNSQPFAMEADGATLQVLLRCIDPAKPMPPISRNTIEKVLRAAHKYQIEKFITYFELVAGQECNCVCIAKDHGCLPSTEPMLILYLAELYHLPDLARLALRQLIMEPMDKLIIGNPVISLKMWPHLLRLRKERTEWLLDYIDRLRDSVHMEQDHVCAQCHSTVMAMTRRVHDAPSWSLIEEDISSWVQECGWQRRWRSFPIGLKALGKDAKELEKQLPALPKGIF